MISNKIDDYKVLSILGSEGDFTYYKVQDKVTGMFYQWHAINYNMDEDLQYNALKTELSTRKELIHKNFLRVFDYIYHSCTKTVYIIAEYCMHGSLTKILQNCLKNRQYINESLIWNVLYTIANLIKESVCQIDDISLNNIFLNNLNSVQLLSLRFPGENLHINVSKDEICPIEQLGTVIYKMCTLDCSQKGIINFDYIPAYYSEELYNIMEFLLHKTDIEPTIDAILYHPTILVNLVKSDNIYVAKPKHKIIRDETELFTNKLQMRVEQLKIREADLNIQERKLEEREHQIRKRERKIILTERLVKEKIRRADIYLKASTGNRTHIKIISSAENNYKSSEYYTQERVYENINVKKHSQEKLGTHANKITQRTNVSSRKIKFKGHSPLKDIKNSSKHSPEGKERNHKKKVPMKVAESRDSISEINSAKVTTKNGEIYSRSNEVLQKTDLLRKNTTSNQNMNKIECISAENTSEQQTVTFRKSKISPKNGVSTDKFATSRRSTIVRRSFLNIMFNRAGVKKNSKLEELKEQEQFAQASIQNYEEIGDFMVEDKLKVNKPEMLGCKSLLWTEDTKKQAFDMLRVINEEKDDINMIKHTYL